MHHFDGQLQLVMASVIVFYCSRLNCLCCSFDGRPKDIFRRRLTSIGINILYNDEPNYFIRLSSREVGSHTINLSLCMT